MKHRWTLSVVLALAGAWSTAQARVVTVTTANNENPPAGTVSLLQALQGLQDGDEIRFNIPGAGPHYIQTPAEGYPLIQANNVTLDGYTQPGATANTNPILAANNAKLKIVLDSRSGNFSSMNYAPASDEKTGYDESEFAVLGVYHGTNVTIRGFSILGKVPEVGDNSNYGIGFAVDYGGTTADCHVEGCWIGVDPDGVTLSGTKYAITAFRHRDSAGQNQVTVNNLTIGVKKGSSNPRAEFNVIVQSAIPVIIEGQGARISGNFLGVLPDGVTEYNVALDPAYTGDWQFEGAIEIGRSGNNTLIGTDGDGVNDADERNVICGTMAPSMNGYDHTIEFYGNNPGTNIVIAGNYIGVGVDGRWFTNAVPAINASGGAAQYQIGSNLDGVSDSVEGNVIYNNWPFSDITPEVLGSDPGGINFYDELSTTGTVSTRGNVLVNNFPLPVSPLKSSGDFLKQYYARMVADVEAGVEPTLGAATTNMKLVGTTPVTTADYPTTVIDLYALDEVGHTNGMAANIEGLPHGFIQGRLYLGSFVDNGAADRDPAKGSFDFDLSAVDLKGATNLTITANYSKQAASNLKAVYVTSPFSAPVTVAAREPVNTEIHITSLQPMGVAASLTWTGGTAPYLIQKKSSLSDAQWADVMTTSDTTALVAATGAAGFFRVSDHATAVVTAFTAWLGGDGEAPTPVTTDGSGFATLSLKGSALTYNVSYTGLSAAATAAHIHGPAATTESVGVLVGFSGVSGTSGLLTGTANLIDTTKTALLAGRTYVNAHTPNHASGEIRGQVVPVVYHANLLGSSEVPGVVTSGTGTAKIMIVGNVLTYWVSYSGLNGNATLAHIHGPAVEGQNSGVMIPFPAPSGTSGTIRGSAVLTRGQLATIVDGKAYVNIHTATSGGGEIRGQILP